MVEFTDDQGGKNSRLNECSRLAYTHLIISGWAALFTSSAVRCHHQCFLLTVMCATVTLETFWYFLLQNTHWTCSFGRSKFLLITLIKYLYILWLCKNFIVCNSICWNRCLLYAGSAWRNLSPSKLLSLALIPPPPSLESVSRLPTKQRHTFFSISSQIRIWEEKRQTKKAHLEVIYRTDRVRAAACIMRQGKQHANTIHNASRTTVNKSNTALKSFRSVGWKTFFIKSAFEPSEKQLRLFQGLWSKDRLM